MDVVKEGDTIQILCEGKLQDGRLFFKNDKDDPMTIVVGAGKIFPVLEQELRDMKVGESKTITLQPHDAFGDYNQNLVMVAPKESVDPQMEAEIGSRIDVDLPSGKKLTGVIKEISENTVTIDFNHPLAGKIVIFTVTILSINPNDDELVVSRKIKNEEEVK